MSLRHTSIMAGILTLGSCAPGSRQGDPPQAAPVRLIVRVAVQNHGDADIDIYATAINRGRRRIGTVMRASTGNLVIPESMLTWPGAELVVVPIGGRAESILSCPTIAPGARLLLVVERETVLSTCSSNRWLPAADHSRTEPPSRIEPGVLF